MVLCGNGWYGGRHPSGENGDGMFGNGFLLSAEIVVDGERIAVTDESWLSIATPIVFSEIYDGEIYDSRREIFADNGKVKPDVTTFGEKALSTNNPQAKIIERISPKICVRENYIPSLIITPSGGTVLDFGREITGWAEFEAYIPRGGEVKLSYGEILQNGEFYRDNLRTAKAEFIAVGDGRTRKFRPHFTFFGFRYVKVDGLNLTSEDVNKFVGKAIYSDLPIGGKIISSNEKLNRFIENVFQSQKDNFSIYLSIARNATSGSAGPVTRRFSVKPLCITPTVSLFTINICAICEKSRFVTAGHVRLSFPMRFMRERN